MVHLVNIHDNIHDISMRTYESHPIWIYIRILYAAFLCNCKNFIEQRKSDIQRTYF